MPPSLSLILPASFLLSSLTYFSTTISNAKPPGNLFRIDLELPSGWIRGVKKVSRNGERGYYFFRGIPYAEQPVGELRFEPPIPAKPWKPSILDATRYGAWCLQPSIVNSEFFQSERCLFLNVAVPKTILPTNSNNKYNQNDATKQLYPVIVYFYGGGFMIGQSNFYSPSYFMDEDVVYVSLNYRLGFLGFLNTGDGAVRGNMGLKDQTMALRWVQDNIVYFGGDPNRVTIMGQSAGGISCHFHTLSPLSRGLFHRAILQSGVAVNLSLQKNPQEEALKLGQRLHCPTNNTREMVACLKAIPAKQLIKTNPNQDQKDFTVTSQIGPSVEGVHDSDTFLFDTPTNLIRHGIVNNVPWIVGLNSNEGVFFALNFSNKNKTNLNVLNREWNRYGPRLLGYEGQPNSDQISQAIRQKYLGRKEIRKATIPEFALIISDGIFAQGVYDAIRSHAMPNSVYAYYFTYKPEFSLNSILAGIPSASFLPRIVGYSYSFFRNWFKRVFKIPNGLRLDGGHGDELALFFPFYFISRRIIPGHVDYPMSREVIRAWTHFASTGKPGKIFGVDWTPTRMQDQFGSTEFRYLKLDSNPMMIPEPFTSRIEFWKSLQLDPEDNYYNNN